MTELSELMKTPEFAMLPVVVKAEYYVLAEAMADIDKGEE